MVRKKCYLSKKSIFRYINNVISGVNALLLLLWEIRIVLWCGTGGEVTAKNSLNSTYLISVSE